jgi:alkylation response protein AidB-like acyl-CoA dehydrogenase
VPLARVPWGRRAATLVVVVRGADGEWIAVVPRTTPDWSLGSDLLDEPRDSCVLQDVPVRVLGPVEPRAVIAALRVRRSAELVGAIDAAVDLSLEHASVRTQFGRPLRAFQAVGAHLARMVGEREVVRAALTAAPADLDPGRVAALWSVIAVAAGDVARAAHQVHGAVGTTREHRLQLSTRRLWARRDEDGGPRRADLDVAADALGGADATWHWLTKE